ncbi:MAG: hypothetical protein P8Q92_09655 [Pseudoprimorskyibacter sp.]|nr:hypothetical protein [Pseudoprimorskyibacter sp.]
MNYENWEICGDCVSAAFRRVEVHDTPPAHKVALNHILPALCATVIVFTLSDGWRGIVNGSTALHAVVGLPEGLTL